jgi:hypothetical protein
MHSKLFCAGDYIKFFIEQEFCTTAYKIFLTSTKEWYTCTSPGMDPPMSEVKCCCKLSNHECTSFRELYAIESGPKAQSYRKSKRRLCLPVSRSDLTLAALERLHHTKSAQNNTV